MLAKRFLIIYILSLLLFSCNSDHSYDILEEVETLLDRDELDSASITLNLVLSVDRDEDRALYNLLKTRIDYLQNKDIKNDSMINYSIAYYDKIKDNKRLADSYYYKGCINIVNEKYNIALENYKKAELLSRDINNLSLRHKILEGLAYINESMGANKIAICYSKETLKLSKECKNFNWIAYALGSLAVEYYNIGRKDSMKYYLDQNEPMLKYIPLADQALFLSNIGSFYLNIDPHLSEMYYNRSLKLKKNAPAYVGLSNVYQDDMAKSISLLKKAYPLAESSEKIKVLQGIASRLNDRGYSSDAYYYMCQALSKSDSINQKIQSDNIRNVQSYYDLVFLKIKYRRIIQLIIILFVVCVLVLIILLVYRKYKYNKNQKQLMHDQLLISMYNQQIEALNANDSESQKTITILKHKIDSIQNDNKTVLYKGKQLYESMKNENFTVVKWGHNEFVWFIEYYKLIDLFYVNHLETDYSGLTVKNQFFQILYHMGKSDKEVQYIMGISPSTVRSNKSRIKSKKYKVAE